MKQIIFFYRMMSSKQLAVLRVVFTPECATSAGFFKQDIKHRTQNSELRTQNSPLTTRISRFFLLLLFITFVSKTFGQQIPLDIAVQNRYNEITLDADTSIFTGFRSVNWIEVEPYLNNIRNNIIDSIFGLSKTPGNYSFKNIGSNNWIQSANGKHSFAIDPYVVAVAGTQNADSGSKALAQVIGGLQLRGVYKDKLSYSIGFATGYGRFPAYVNSFIDSNQNYIPGAGKGSRKSNGYTSTQVNANITYQPSKHFLFAAGYGKNFIGDGYRSLILSDNVSNYPYLRFQTRLWRLTYNVIYNKFTSPRYKVYGEKQRKYSVMHYLGINFSSKFQLGLYDNIIWFAKDSLSGETGFDVQYINPVIFMRPIDFTIGSPDNAFLGITMKYKIYKDGFLYSQIAIDDLNLTASFKNHAQSYGNKYALQLGIYNKDFLHVKDLSWRFEWNGVRPYMYGHGFGKTGLNYTHNNQALADPFNANFHEFISMFQYHNERWYGMLENLFTIRGENPGNLPYENGENLWGGELNVAQYLPYGSKTLQGIKHKYFYNQLTAGYLLNPKNRLSLQADVVYRHHSAPGISGNNVFFMFGIQTRLFNYYHDF